MNKNFLFSFSSNESIRTRLLDNFGIDISFQHADPQPSNHRALLRKSKPDFYSTKFSISRFLFEYLATNDNALTLSAAYALLPKELCEQLKSENGGLKSIILSYRHALHFDAKTKTITLTDPQLNSIKLKQTDSSKQRIKTKPCFFYAFHRNSCPLTDQECAFSHCTK